MKFVLDEIKRRGDEICRHPFLADLQNEDRLDSVIAFAPSLTFWVFAFQDILRLNEELVTDPLLVEIVRLNREEDRNHDMWFLHDLTMFGTPRDLRWVFGPMHRDTRDSAYTLVSEAIRAESDFARMALLLVLETTGQAFFTRVAACVERSGFVGKLKYFSKSHLNAEQAHDLWERETQLELASIALPPPVRADALATVRRAFTAFERLFDHLRSMMEHEVQLSPAFASASSTPVIEP